MEKYQINEASANMLASAINEGRIVATVKSVSQSGMSRKIKFAAIVNNMLRPITHHICGLYGNKMTEDDCIRVRGCGMNMIFHTLDYVAARLTEEGYPCKYHGYEQI